MLNLMLVDDEPLSVNYLADTLHEWGNIELNVTTAYSGIQALEKLRKLRPDILLTDIRMPGMGGLELASHTLARWPRCKIIFLSAHSDFEYIQTALRGGGIDYVLKSEGDEPIFQAIEKAAEEIRAEWHAADVSLKARQMLQQALPALRAEYMREWLNGGEDTPDGRNKKFQELHVSLDASRPVYVVLGRVDDWGAYRSATDRSLLLYSIENITEEFVAKHAGLLFVPYDRSRFVWLTQPPLPQDDKDAGAEWEHLKAFVTGTAESIQEACRKLLKLHISFLFSSQPCSWEQAARQFDILRQMSITHLTGAKEMLVIEAGDDGRADERSSQTFFAEAAFRHNMRKLDLLESYLDNGETAKFTGMYDALTRFDVTEMSETKATYLVQEMFANLSAFFLSYVNRRNLVSDEGVKRQLDPCAHLDHHDSLEAMLGCFRRLGAALADRNGRLQQQRQSNEIIRAIHQYVQQFIREELSLTRLAEVVHLSPPYLSRLYKQLTGTNLLDYITEVRITRAKHLLKNTTMKIHEVAAEVGFDSAPYFTRLFKKVTNVTPLEYREVK